MRHAWILTVNRLHLALRTRAVIFFTLVMPLVFLFAAILIFGRGGPRTISYILGVILALTVMGSFWGLSLQLVMFREQGILRRFRLAPVGVGALLASSILSNYFLTIPAVIVEYLICRWVFGMASWGNLWEAFLLITLGSAAFSAIGLIVASIANSTQETQVINNAVWLVLLSGATVPLPLLPGWAQRLMLFTPGTYLATGLESALLHASGWEEVGLDIASLAVTFAVAFEVSRRLFRWEPEEKIEGRAKAWAAATIIPFLLLGIWQSSYGHRRSEANQLYQSIGEKLMPNGTR